jgi:hypothetical protein
MGTEQKLSELIPLKVNKMMAAQLAVMAGGERKRAEYIRKLIARDIQAAMAQTEEGRFCEKLVIEMRQNPELRRQAYALLPKATRKRVAK